MWLQALIVAFGLTVLCWMRFGHAAEQPRALNKSDCPHLAAILKQSPPDNIKATLEGAMLQLGCAHAVAPVTRTPDGGEWL